MNDHKQKMCKNCVWFLGGYCTLNPEAVRKKEKQLCSHYLEKPSRTRRVLEGLKRPDQ